MRQSLKTDDLAKARAQRDILVKADNELSAAMSVDGKKSAQTVETYKAAKLLSEVLGFSYRPADELAGRPVEEIVRRVTAIMSNGTPAVVSTAVMRGQQVLKVRITGRSTFIGTKSSRMRLLARAQLSEGNGKRSNAGRSTRLSP
ncbi:MAG TPA: hypothetical protein VKC66_30540 [Xanthobacteraceae bacterium]|nr:hypothetical protein [Xanthobacteraceae bacterium]